MSPHSEQVVRDGFESAMSGWRSREAEMHAKGLASALSPTVIERLTDARVGVPEAAGNLAGVWDRMMDHPDRPAPAWYFGHNRRLTAVADKYGMPSEKVINASAAMSPQNDPDSEYRAASAMTDAVVNKRTVLDKRTGKRRRLTSMKPDEVADITSSANVKNVSAAPDFDLAGFRNAGTNRVGGWRTLAEPDHDEVATMQSAKVPFYAKLTSESKADSPLHHEYEARFGDQVAARDVRKGREADAAAGKTGSETIRGVPDRVDLYGLMGKDAADDDPIHDHHVLGRRGGYAVPDTWMSAMLSGQDMRDMPGSPSPAKMAGSQTKSTSAPIPGTTFPTPGEVTGGKPLTGNAAWGVAAVGAIQEAAIRAREPEAQTDIPPVMMQEMTWTHGRREVAESTRAANEASGRNPGAAANRVKKLTSGDLAGQKEFRPATGSREPQRLDTPGLFHNGNDNPLDTDSVSLTTAAPTRSTLPGGGTTMGRDPALHGFHDAATRETPSLAKRRAIKAAIASTKDERGY
jgi:hypothetical protein